MFLIFLFLSSVQSHDHVPPHLKICESIHPDLANSPLSTLSCKPERVARGGVVPRGAHCVLRCTQKNLMMTSSCGENGWTQKLTNRECAVNECIQVKRKYPDLEWACQNAQESSQFLVGTTCSASCESQISPENYEVRCSQKYQWAQLSLKNPKHCQCDDPEVLYPGTLWSCNVTGPPDTYHRSDRCSRNCHGDVKLIIECKGNGEWRQLASGGSKKSHSPGICPCLDRPESQYPDLAWTCEEFNTSCSSKCLGTGGGDFELICSDQNTWEPKPGTEEPKPCQCGSPSRLYPRSDWMCVAPPAIDQYHHSDKCYRKCDPASFNDQLVIECGKNGLWSSSNSTSHLEPDSVCQCNLEPSDQFPGHNWTCNWDNPYEHVCEANCHGTEYKIVCGTDGMWEPLANWPQMIPPCSQSVNCQDPSSIYTDIKWICQSDSYEVGTTCSRSCDQVQVNGPLDIECSTEGIWMEPSGGVVPCKCVDPARSYPTSTWTCGVDYKSCIGFCNLEPTSSTRLTCGTLGTWNVETGSMDPNDCNCKLMIGIVAVPNHGNLVCNIDANDSKTHLCWMLCNDGKVASNSNLFTCHEDSSLSSTASAFAEMTCEGGVALLIGGVKYAYKDDATPTNTLQAYDVDTGPVGCPVPDLPEVMGSSFALWYDNAILVCGSPAQKLSELTDVPKCYQLRKRSSQWNELYNFARGFESDAALIGGHVQSIGGYNPTLNDYDERILRDVIDYDGFSNKINESLPKLGFRIFKHCLTSITHNDDHSMETGYICGGSRSFLSGKEPTGDCYKRSNGDLDWFQAGSIPDKLDWPTCHSFRLENGQDFILALNSGSRYVYFGTLKPDMKLDWNKKRDLLSEKRFGSGIVNINDRILVFGGEQGIVEEIIYDSSNDKFTVQSLPKMVDFPRDHISVVVVPNSFCE